MRTFVFLKWFLAAMLVISSTVLLVEGYGLISVGMWLGFCAGIVYGAIAEDLDRERQR